MKWRIYIMRNKKLLAMGLLSTLVLTGMPVNVLTSYAAETDVSQLVQEASTTFTFTETGINTLSGSEDAYKIEGNDLTIKESGVYIITGNCSDGSVTVKKGTTGVTLILQDLTLASSTGAPICINKENTDTTIVINGTNTLTDNEDPADEESTDEEVADAFDGAALKLKDDGDLTITGTGTLNINGVCKNGIKGGDNATINIGASATDSFTLNVTASNDGISGDGADGVAGLNIIGGNVNVSAADDGIKSDYILNIGQSGSTAGATINVTNSTEGIEGATVNLYGGTGNIVSSDDGINAANSDLTDYSYSLNIYGGTWYVNAGGDGIDSNGTVLVSGGVTDISSSTQNDNNPIDWGENSSITVNGGTIIGIGMGGMQQGFTSGNYVFFGTGGMNGGMNGGMPGGMNGGQPSGMPSDMSGNTSGRPSGMPGGMSGGMPGGMNSGQPSDMSGGMPSGIPSDMSGEMSQQGSVSLNAGDSVSILDASGNTIYTTTVKKSANSVIFASPLLTSGSTYTLSVNGTAVATATTNGSGSGFVPSGNEGNPSGESGNEGTPSGESGNNENENQNESSNASTPVYRFYNSTSGDHLYTTSEAEKETLRNSGWTYEGIAFYSLNNSNSSAAVYRVYNPYSGEHHYTKDMGEYTYLQTIGWQDEGLSFYAKTIGENPVYRLFNPYANNNTHHYTNSLSEYSYLTSIGWQDEGICWYQ